MCFEIITNDRRFSKRKVAVKNIICYKLSTHYRQNRVKNNFNPYFQDSFTYEIDKPTNRVRIKRNSRYINEGYHSCKTLKDEFIQRRKEYKAGKFIIPKGTKYYENKTEYVSETLIFKGYIK